LDGDDTLSFKNQRQGGRVVMRVPVEYVAQRWMGARWRNPRHTGVIGVLGAMIWTSRMLQVGTEVELTTVVFAADRQVSRSLGKGPTGQRTLETGNRMACYSG